MAGREGPDPDERDGLALTVDVAVVVDHRDQPKIDPDAISALVGATLRAEGATGPWEVTVAIVTDDHLAGLHARFLGDPSPTDIMTFSRDEDFAGAGEKVIRGGDLVISWDRAAEQGAEHGMTTGEEVRFLVVHGLLHLCGWEDDTDERRAAMLARGAEITRQVATT